MNYVKLGNTGLDVSPISLGCMSFGDPTKWFHKWVLNEADTKAMVHRAIELGINFFDTANVYSLGTSEEYLGRVLKDFKRDELVVATKVFSKMYDGPNGQGLSRKAILSQADQSLKRLGMDYIDLYITHRWDKHTPIEETLDALTDLVKAGKVRYIGASAMYAWQFQKAINTSEKHGYAKFISMQNHYNLLYREDERELVPYCEDAKIALTPYSPLAAGRLARPLDTQTNRSDTDLTAKSKYDDTLVQDSVIIERVAALADKHQATMGQIALAWLLHQPQVVSPIIGTTKIHQLEDAVKAVDMKLTTDELAYLAELYLPHKVSGAL